MEAAAAAKQQTPMHEGLRRALHAVAVAEQELRAARFAEGQRAIGLQVEAPDVAAAEARLEQAKAKAGEISAEITAAETEEQRLADEEAARADEARCVAIEAADADLLSARRAADVAALDRLSAAQSGASDAVYAKKVQAHLSAHLRAAAALAARESLED